MLRYFTVASYPFATRRPHNEGVLMYLTVKSSLNLTSWSFGIANAHCSEALSSHEFSFVVLRSQCMRQTRRTLLHGAMTRAIQKSPPVSQQG